MRVNINHMLYQIGKSASGVHAYTCNELAKHLRELRDRTKAGDMVALRDFFELYIFEDGQDYPRRSAQETAVAPACDCDRSSSWKCRNSTSDTMCGCGCHDQKVPNDKVDQA